MNLIFSMADWFFAANAWQKTGFVMLAMFIVGTIAIFALLALGGGFARRNYDAAFQDETAAEPSATDCDASSICAWCYPEQPHMKARGICPHHKRDMVEQAREFAARNGGVL